LGAVVGAGLSTAAYTLGIESGSPLRVARYAPTTPNWPPGFRLRLGVVADLHAGEPHMGPDRVRRVVATANALRPDATLLLGDLNASHHFLSRRLRPAETVALLAGLRAPLGTYAILGNHDWWEDEAAQRAGRGPTEAHRALEACGIPVLENTGRRLVKGGQPFWLLGLGDQWAWRGGSIKRQHRGGVDDLPATLAVATDDAPAILMAHEPDIFPAVPARIALTLAGHTHGGQVRLVAVHGFEVRQSLRVRTRRRGRPAPDRLRRPRLQHRAHPLRRAAGRSCWWSWVRRERAERRPPPPPRTPPASPRAASGRCRGG
jgi:predicted MPP superfamily phosphohydrolase